MLDGRITFWVEINAIYSFMAIFFFLRIFSLILRILYSYIAIFCIQTYRLCISWSRNLDVLHRIYILVHSVSCKVHSSARLHKLKLHISVLFLPAYDIVKKNLLFSRKSSSVTKSQLKTDNFSRKLLRVFLREYL